MATSRATSANPYPAFAALQQETWRSRIRLSSLADRAEQILEGAGFDRAPWLAVALASGIAAWFALANRWEWLALIAGTVGAALAALLLMRADGRYPYLRQASAALALLIAAGCGLVWAKSSLIGTPPISHIMAAPLIGTVLDRYDMPADGRARLTLAVREPRTGRPIRVRISMPDSADQPGLAEGAVVRLRARLMPPGAPQLPGARNFAQSAWFEGVAANGSVIGGITVVRPASGDNWLARIRHAAADHVRARVPGSAGGIAATLVSGTRGGISQADQQAMRDAGLTHLLAISGLHVSAVVAGAYLIAFRLLALFPWLALRVRVPLMATGVGAAAGISYTLLTGTHLPTVRACLGALLVLGAMALGRAPLSMRLLAGAAFGVMLLWPEEVVGPSFQLSFGSVVAIIALHDAAPVHAFIAPRAEAWWRHILRHGAMLLLTGMVIDLALMPIALFHFHRAGMYGSVANLIAIPLVTFVSMPFIAAGLVLDIAGLGAPAWWVVSRSLEGLLVVTHWLVSRPGAVSLLPSMGGGTYVLFVAGMLWLGLWHGRMRLWGLVPALAATASLALMRAPDVLITGDARNLGITSPDGARLLVLREGRTPYTREALLEVAGMAGVLAPLADWPGARCNHDFCLVELARGGRPWRILIARNSAMVGYGAMARACAAVDIVVAQRKLYGPCRPALIKADRVMLMRSGGLALDLVSRQVTSVEDSEGEHPWWRAPHRLPAHADDDWDLPAAEAGGVGARGAGSGAARGGGSGAGRGGAQAFSPAGPAPPRQSPPPRTGLR